MSKKKNNLWHKPTERPSNGYIYFIKIYKSRRYRVDSGYYVNDREYIALDETKVFWNKIYLWCYPSEFSKMIQTTFKKRQRVFHLRKYKIF